MKTTNNAKGKLRASEGKPCAMLGAGSLAASLDKYGDEQGGWRYRFNIFRMNKVSGRVSHKLSPRDVPDLVRLAQLLAFTLSEEDGLDGSLRDDLGCLFACLSEVFSWTPDQAPRVLRPDSPAAQALRGVLDYLWDDESRNFADNPASDHIYRRLVVLDSWLHGRAAHDAFRLHEADLAAIEDAFGVCPICGKHDGSLNVRRVQWFVCHTHRVRWSAGESHSFCSPSETPEVWRERWNQIGDYRQVTPLYPAPRTFEANV